MQQSKSHVARSLCGMAERALHCNGSDIVSGPGHARPLLRSGLSRYDNVSSAVVRALNITIGQQ
jgi:hypothetical protein